MSAEWRETLGVTQPELAKEAGVSKTLIALIEKGQRPLVPPSRDEIWAAMSGFMYRQALNPTGAFKFWATFFGPLDTGQLMGLDKTPAQRVRDYARQMEHDYEEKLRESKASERQAWDNNRFLLDAFDAEATKISDLERLEQIREESKQRVKKGN